MEVFSATTQTYNDLFVKNYDKLVKFCNGNEDRVIEKYIDIHERLNIITFTANTLTLLENKLLSYIKSGLYNNFKTEKRLEKHTISPDDCNDEIEDKLQKLENLNSDNQTYEEQLQYISERLFNYIKLKYPQDWNYIFTTYYLYDSRNKKITYEQLSTVTGYSISKCCNVIKKIKADLRDNLINEL